MTFRSKDPAADDPSSACRSLQGSYTDSFGTLNYRLFITPRGRSRPPLFVMLHGATQSASDFAVGTRMHEVIAECGGLALFPEQSRSSHPLGSWNWYSTRHQAAEAGEPSMLAGLTRRIIEEHDVDRSRVYVAGMSAGGAMAMILGQAYPDLYAAVGVHSGLPTGVARDVVTAMRAMNSGPPAEAGARRQSGRTPPTIVFHGDRDQTVHPLNAAALLAQVVDADGKGAAQAAIRVPGGREVTLVRHARRKGRPAAELWIVHGGGHAWTGGSPEGSYTDESGPDASREMLRFFLSQRLSPGSARTAGRSQAGARPAR